MKFTKLFLEMIGFLGCFVLLTGCEPFGPTSGSSSLNTPAEVAHTYPITFGGSSSITDWGITYSGTAIFSANADDTCSLTVTYQLTTTDFKTGAESQDTIAWYIFGKHNREAQVCNFQSCNDAGYIASGEMLYLESSTDPTTVTCTIDDQITTIKVNALGH